MPLPRGKALRDYGRYGSVGIELVLSILIGLWLGKKGDERFHTAPWLTLLGLVVGVYASVRTLLKVAGQMNREAERAEREESEARARILGGDPPPEQPPGEGVGPRGSKRDDPS